MCNILTVIHNSSSFHVGWNYMNSQIASNRWANDSGWSCWQHGTVGVLTLTQHWTKTKVSTTEVLLLAQRWNFNYAPMVDFELWGKCWPKNMLANNSRVIFLNIKFILIMQKLYNLLLGDNSVILFFNNDFIIYLVILSDFDKLKLDKILEIFIYSLYGCSVKI